MEEETRRHSRQPVPARGLPLEGQAGPCSRLGIRHGATVSAIQTPILEGEEGELCEGSDKMHLGEAVAL